MESAIKHIETTRYEARIAHALRSRLVGRDLSMLDLPNETLFNIIQLVSKNSIPPCQTCTQPDLPHATNRGSWDTKSIQNLRLVCRHLSNLSSQFLVPVLSVRTDPDAMARLEEVSHHPSISKGVRYLDIGCLGLSVPGNIDIFTTACRCKLQDMRDNYECLLKISHPAASDRWFADKLLEMQNVERLTSELEPVQVMGAHRSVEKVKTDRIIAMAYEKYLQRYIHDRFVVEAGTFAEAISKAKASMPWAEMECVADEWCLNSPAGCSHCHTWFTTSSEPGDVAGCLAKTLERSLDVLF